MIIYTYFVSKAGSLGKDLTSHLIRHHALLHELNVDKSLTKIQQELFKNCDGKCNFKTQNCVISTSSLTELLNEARKIGLKITGWQTDELREKTIECLEKQVEDTYRKIREEALKRVKSK